MIYANSQNIYKETNLTEEMIQEKQIDMMDYYSQAMEYEEKYLYDEAIAYYHKSLKVAKSFLDSEHEYIGAIYNSLGFVCTDSKDYDLSRKYYLKALHIFKQNSDYEDSDIALLYNNLAVLYKNTQEYNTSIYYSLRAIEIEERENTPSITDSYYNLGLLYQKIREYDSALIYYNKALKKIETKKYIEPLEMATHYDILGAFYREIEDNPKALAFYQKSLDTRLKVFEKSDKYIAEAYHNIASIYEDMRDYRKAISYYMKALDIHKELDDTHSLEIATTYNNISSSYNELEDYISAKKYIDKALQIKENIFRKDDIDLAISYNNRGLIYENMKLYDKALIEYNHSLKIYQKTLPEESYEIAIEYNNIGSIHRRFKELDKDIYYINKSKNILLKVVNDRHNMLSIIYNNLGLLYEDKHDYHNSYQNHKLSLEIFLLHRDKNFLALDTNQKQNYISTFGNRIENLLNATAFDINRKIKIQLNTLNKWLKYKGTVTESSNILTMMEQNADEETQNSIKELKKLNIRLSNLSQNSNQREYIKEQISQLEIKLNDSSAKFREFKNLQNISEQNISKILKEDELYIDFAKTDEYYYIFTLDKSNKITFEQISKEDKTILNQKIQEFRVYNHKIASQKKEERAKVDKVQEKKDTQKLLYQVYNILSQYINLKTKKSLIISPDGLLNFLPFEALYDGEKYLVESVNISYIPSGRELVRQSRREQTKSKTDDIVVFAHPDYDASDKKRNPQDYNQTDTKSWNMGYLYDLNGSKDEAKIIKELYPQARLFEDKEATVEKLFEIKSPKILHISTHGAFIDDKNITNPMEQTFLAFVDANLMVMETNATGIATALKLSSLSLNNTELVFLSACETGLGTVQTAEGVQGLPKAFIQAGAKNIIMSLWQVDDSKTTELTRYFYENIKSGMGYKEALRESKLKMIDMHPYYWSGFVFSGVGILRR